MSALEMFPEVVPAEDPNRRYTTREFMAWIKAKAGVDAWDLDAAADEESHHAPRWFSLQPYPGSAGVNGLVQSWLPPKEWHEAIDQRYAAQTWRDYEMAHTWRIFINPPFDDLAPWIERVWQTIEHLPREVLARVAMVLPGNRTEQGFWQDHVEPFLAGHENANRYGYSLTAFSPRTRQAYAKPGSGGVDVGSAKWPSVVLVWRRR